MPERIPLLLLTSQLCTAEIWAAVAAGLSDAADVRIEPPPERDSIAAMAAALLEAQAGRFALAAHGMGGFIALEMLRQGGDRVVRLALLGTLASADGPDQASRRQGYSNLVEAGRFAEVIEARIPLLFHPDRAGDPALTAIARAMAKATGPGRFLQQQQAIIGRIDSGPHLGRIRCPTLVIGADADRVAPPDTVRELAAGIPEARLAMLEDCGHFMQLEQPAAVTALLRDWLTAA